MGVQGQPGGKLHQKLLQGLALQQGGHHDLAREVYEEVLALQPDHFDALHLLGIALSQTGRPEEGISLFRRASKICPDNPAVHNNLGNVLKSLGRNAEAIVEYECAITLKPDYLEAHYNRGLALNDLSRYEAALRCFDQAIALEPRYAEAHNERGLALKQMERLEDAVRAYDRAIALKPDYADAWNNRGLALHGLRDTAAAIESYDKAIALNPNLAEPYANRAGALIDARNPVGAIECCATALSIRPSFAEAFFRRADAFAALKQYDAAIDSYEQAIALNPSLAGAYRNLGEALAKRRRFTEAIPCYDKALVLEPDTPFLPGLRLDAQMAVCDWTGIEDRVAKLEDDIRHGACAAVPGQLLAVTDSAALLRQLAEAIVSRLCPDESGGIAFPHRGPDKIRLGYYSGDFHNHATMHLMAELFEQHDKSRFELIAMSFGPAIEDAMRARVVNAFDQFIDVRDRADSDVARLSRDMRIDIAIDLKGFTEDSRPKIFASRAAPIQVSYLGFPGTMGASYMDYLIADQVLIPEQFRRFYSEKIVYLPDSYQVNDSRREISNMQYERKEFSLPDDAFIFCSFNANYKIVPAMFDGWMRILRSVEDGVLWLLSEHPETQDNLRREAAARGIGPERLVFCQRMPTPEHLARHRLADLFLDTFPCNAHTTASDALWAGLPLLTRAGEGFASRVAASLLNAVGLPELVTSTQEDYESLAIALAQDRERLAAIRRRLTDNRATAPLFDAQRFARNIEAAYMAMFERHQAGLPPDHLYI